MTINPDIYADMQKSGLTLPIRPFTREEIDKTYEELAYGEINYDSANREYVFKREVASALAHIQDRVLELQSQVSFYKASARITITSDLLSTTDETNDTLECLSETPFEFEFTDSRRFTKVVLAPIAGREPHELMFDKIIKEATGGYTACVYPISATKLQMVNWNGASWDALAWDAGWVIDITQYVDGDLPKLVA